ncbi:MAG: PEGA domain-containing protein [Gallionellaceae bacterium]|nr:MAG: PEGA domain-containing protein [Gallionellaceae bacterium]
MKHFLLRTSFAFLFFGCFSANLYAGWFDVDDSISVPENKKPNPNAPSVKYAATIRVAGYADGRSDMTPKKIGISTQRVPGITGKNLVLDRDVTDFVSGAVKKRFDDAGFQVVDGASALFELSGIIKELTYNVNARDEIALAIETTLKEAATGKVVWSGVVVEKKERFAGISGNSKSDIANNLGYELGIVTQKTVDAISASLVASRPDLFNLTPGTKNISGVTVFQASGAGSSVPAAAANGTLVLNTRPARAKVYLDGVYYGMSPLRAEIEVGIREVSVKVDGYKTVVEKVSVRKGDTTELELVLER